jgi:outer membrane protein assembly factor BamB
MRRNCTSLAVLLTFFVGCAEPDQSDQPPVQTEDERLEQLRSLPYTGGTTVAQDEPIGVTVFNEEQSARGYRLYTVALLGRAELITRTGEVVRIWEQPGDRWERAELLPDGALLVVGIEDLGWRYGKSMQTSIPDASRYVMKLDWSGELVWKRKIQAHHDIELMPGGSLLLLTFERRTLPDIHSTIDTRDDYLTMLDQDGHVLTSRSMLDAINRHPDVFPLEPAQPSGRGLRPWVDLFHSNSLEWIRHDNLLSIDSIYGPEKILVSIRHQDRVAIYDWQEAKFVWSWGQGEISGPHDAHMLENGHVLLFDNGLSRDWSRVVELDPLSRKIVWTYEGSPRQSFYSASKGSVQRLPNGNTLLAESDRGRAIEVNSDGETVWEFVCPYRVDKRKRASIVRMVHHSGEFIERLLTNQ